MDLLVVRDRVLMVKRGEELRLDLVGGMSAVLRGYLVEAWDLVGDIGDPIRVWGRASRADPTVILALGFDVLVSSAGRPIGRSDGIWGPGRSTPAGRLPERSAAARQPNRASAPGGSPRTVASAPVMRVRTHKRRRSF